MTHVNYRAALDAAIKEYETLGAQRQALDERLSQLAHTITTLSKLLGLTPTIPLGLTAACRLVYRNADAALSPTEVRDRLRAIGFDLSVYTNEMAAIHTVVKRLHEAGELKAVAAGAGVTGNTRFYLWQRPARSIAIGPEIAEFVRGSGAFHTDTTPPAKPTRRRKR